MKSENEKGELKTIGGATTNVHDETDGSLDNITQEDTRTDQSSGGCDPPEAYEKCDVQVVDLTKSIPSESGYSNPVIGSQCDIDAGNIANEIASQDNAGISCETSNSDANSMFVDPRNGTEERNSHQELAQSIPADIETESRSDLLETEFDVQNRNGVSASSLRQKSFTLNYLRNFVKSNYPMHWDGNAVRLPLTFDILHSYFQNCSKRKVKFGQFNGDFVSVAHFRTFICAVYLEYNAQNIAITDSDRNIVKRAYRDILSTLKESKVPTALKTKVYSPINLQEYRWMARQAMISKADFRLYCNLHTYLLFTWNLLEGSGKIDMLGIGDISWAGDALKIQNCKCQYLIDFMFISSLIVSY